MAPTGRDLLRQARATGGTVGHVAYGQGRKALPAPLVVGRGLGVLPRHQHPAGSLRAWAQRQSVFHQVVAKAVRP